MPWFYAVAESHHDIQNPTSAEKIRLLGEALGLDVDSRVLDVACGRGGPPLILAREFGCHVVGVERSSEFASAARVRVAAAGLTRHIEILEQDAATFGPGRGEWDAALCLGATFVWGQLPEAAAALRPSVRPGGHVAIGEPYWRRRPLPDGVDTQGYVAFPDTVARLEAQSLTLTTVIDSSLDDWDRYESAHWHALEDWLAAHPDDPDTSEIRVRHERARRAYVEHERDLLGWAIFVGRV
jgi:SAM-dependent methyltransferase